MNADHSTELECVTYILYFIVSYVRNPLNDTKYSYDCQKLEKQLDTQYELLFMDCTIRFTLHCMFNGTQVSTGTILHNIVTSLVNYLIYSSEEINIIYKDDVIFEEVNMVPLKYFPCYLRIKVFIILSHGTYSFMKEDIIHSSKITMSEILEQNVQQGSG